jgi:uncharacterized membrane protein
MATLVAVAYPEIDRAHEARNVLMRMQKQFLIDIADAVVVTRDDKGKVHLDQAVPLGRMSAMRGALWGMLVGLLFLVPLFGAALGAATGALAGRFADYGINDDFMRALSEKLQPNTSALFVLARGGTPERILPEVSKFGGTVLQTSLPPEAEQELQSALSEGELKRAG